MSRRASANRASDFPIEFDESKYLAMDIPDDKKRYISNSLITFFQNYADTFPISISTQSVPKFNCFFEVLPDSFEQDINYFYIYVCQFLVAFEPYYAEIPHVGKYMCIVDHILYDFATHPDPLFASTLSILFKNPKMCFNFIMKSKIKTLLKIYMPDNNNFSQVLKIIATKQFYETILSISNCDEILADLFNFVFDELNNPEKQDSNRISFAFIYTFFDFVLTITRHLYYIDSKAFEKILFSTGIFDKINEILLKMKNADIVWNIYHPLLLCSQNQEIPYDPEIFMQLNKLFIHEEFSTFLKCEILSKINNDSFLFESAFCVNQMHFKFHLFLTSDCVVDISYFTIYIEILEKCLLWSKSAAEQPIRKLIELLSPPIQPQIQYNVIFGWLCNIASDPKITPIIFNDKLFYRNLLIDPPLNVAEQYFEYPKFLELFEILFNSKRQPFHSKKLISKIFDFFDYKKSKFYDTFKLSHLLINNFGVDILNYLIDNLTTKKAHLILQDLTIPTLNIPQLFNAGGTFAIIEKHLNMCHSNNNENNPNNNNANDENVELYLLELLMFVQSVVFHTNDRFFDEWVLSLPKESPIFKMTSDQITPFVLNNTVLFLPSLVPLVNNVNVNSPYNYYLLGRYSVPVALKLGVEISNLPQICSYYIAYETYEHYLENGQIANLLKKSASNQEIQCYEFFLESLAGYITIDMPCSIVMFFIKFNRLPARSFPILHISKHVLNIDGEYLTHNNSKLKKLVPNNWYLFTLMKTKIMNWTEIFIDREKVLTIRDIFQFEMIGDSSLQATVPYCVAQNIFAAPQNPDQSFINDFNLFSPRTIQPVLHGGVVAAPIFSISYLLKTNYTYLRNFDKFDEIEGKERDKYFVFLIQTADYLSDDQLQTFFSRFLLTLTKKPEDILQWHIVALVQAILMLKNIQLRTIILASALFDLELWTILKTDRLLNFIEYINEKLDESNLLIFNHIFTKQNFMYSVSLMAYDKQLFNPFFLFWEKIGSKITNFAVLPELVELVCVPKLSELDANVNILEFDISGMLKKEYFTENLEFQIRLVQLIQKLEIIHKQTIFTKETLLSLSFIMPEEIACPLFLSLLHIHCTDVSFITNKISIFAKIAQRFADNQAIWTAFVTIMSSSEFHFESLQNEIPHKIQYPQIYSILLELLISLSENDQKSMLGRCENFLTALFEIYDPIILIEEYNLPTFIHLISQNRELIKVNSYAINSSTFYYSSNSSNSIVPLPISKIEKEFLITKFNENQNSFMDLINTFTYQPIINKNLNLFCSKLITKIFMSIISKNNYRLFKRLMALMIEYCDIELFREFLKVFLITINENQIDPAIIQILAIVFSNLLNRKPEIFDQQLYTEIVGICKSREIFTSFVPFFIFSFNYVAEPSNVVKKILEYQIVILDFLPKLSILFMYLLVMNQIEDFDSIIDNYFLQLKSRSESPALNNNIPFCQLIIASDSYETLCKPEFSRVVEQFNTIFNDEKENKFYSSIETLSYSPLPLDQEQLLGNYIATFLAKSLSLYFIESQQFYYGLNLQLRAKENMCSLFYYKYVSHKSQARTLPVRSYHVSPFVAPITCPVTCAPSFVTIQTPNIQNRSNSPINQTNNNTLTNNNENNIKDNTGNNNNNNFDHENNNKYNDVNNANFETSSIEVNGVKMLECDYHILHLKNYIKNGQEISEELPSDLYRRSALFNCNSSSLLQLFKMMHGDIDMKYGMCTLIRQHFRVSSICFSKNDTTFFILTDAALKDGNLILLDHSPHLAESFLSNEFGPYSMFCGHFLIVVQQTDIILSTKYISSSKDSSILVFSASNGHFILEFTFFPIFPVSALNLNISGLQQHWMTNDISNKEYLETVNFFGLRSFSDFSAYPIFPRIIKNFDLLYEEIANPENLRNLQKPIQTAENNDVSMYEARFRSQKYHHSENVSNAIIVTSLNLRLAPFCYHQWFMNDGWDKGERNFMNISMHLSVNKKTIYELPPEVFAFPEILLNKNKFVLPNGDTFDLVLPEWAQNNIYYFIELIRYSLENENVRNKLNAWIDLNFGVKQASEEDINVYSPLSYITTKINENPEQQRAWMLQCGQVPKKVFENPHPAYSKHSFINPMNITFHPKIFENVPYKLSNDISVRINENFEIIINSTSNQYIKPIEIHPSLFFKRDVHISSDFVVITFSVSLASVYMFIRTKNIGIKLIGQIQCNDTKFSVLHSHQFLCATICQKEVVIWCISNSMVISTISLNNVKVAKFDEETNYLFLTRDKELFMYSLSGELVRKIELPQIVTAMDIVACGFSVYNRYIVTGHIDGSVRVIKIDFKTRQFVVIKERKLFKLKVAKIQGRQNSINVDAFEVSTK